MKNIPLKTVEAQIGNETVKISYRLQLTEIIKHPAQPVLIDEVRRGIRVLDALEKSSDTLVLEDADFDYLKMRLLGTQWPMIAKWVDDFVRDVTEPEKG